MKATILSVAVLLLTVFALVMMPAAEAADVRISALDGGASSIAISPRVTYVLQCSNPSCYRVSLDGGLAVCSTDYNLPTLGNKYEREFDSAGNNRLHAYALDAGAPGCQLYQRTK